MKTFLLTVLALMAFAGNSVLCRLALREGAIDAASFTSVRLLSGVMVLLLLFGLTKSKAAAASKGSWKAAFMLFLYALTFSFAYISLDTGTGALILFASVQITMILAEFMSGKRPLWAEWVGVAMAFMGFVYLVLPSVSTPSLSGFLLMSLSGIAWGYYTLAGKGSRFPLSDTTFNFARTLPLLVLLMAFTLHDAHVSVEGVVLAIISGGLTSAVGYAIWYVALGGLSGIQASVVQLLVPVIAAVGGVVFADEALSMRLLVASAIILGGILMVILGKSFCHRNVSTMDKKID